MHRALTILPDEDFVEVGLEDLALVVMQLQQNSHHGFGELAAQAALAGEVEVLHQLLRQGTAALAHAAR
ncbi:hypothetical protein D3C76_1182400 [compost metagenome]